MYGASVFFLEIMKKGYLKENQRLNQRLGMHTQYMKAGSVLSV